MTCGVSGSVLESLLTHWFYPVPWPMYHLLPYKSHICFSRPNHSLEFHNPHGYHTGISNSTWTNQTLNFLPQAAPPHVFPTLLNRPTIYSVSSANSLGADLEGVSFKSLFQLIPWESYASFLQNTAWIRPPLFSFTIYPWVQSPLSLI